MGSGETDERLDTAAEYLKKLISVTERGFGSLGAQMDAMLEKQDAMLEKQDETIDEIQGLRVDMKSYMDRKFGEIEDDLFMIKSVLKTSGMLN